MADFDSLKKEFVECFKSDLYTEAEFHSDGGAKWIFAVVDREASKKDLAKRGFHYELICRGSECYIELHFELYKYQWPEMRNALQRVLAAPKYKRQIMSTSYYSSMIWRVRTPVFDKDGVNTDVGILRNVVKDAYSFLGGLTSINDDGEFESAKDLELNLPYPLPKVACMLEEGAKKDEHQDKQKYRLTIPSVQRGKVWNAARIETLWDSIFRDIPIGALSVRRRNTDWRALDLLDGQQRAAAVSLGYSPFPDKSRKFESILWVDLCENKDGLHDFHVTTASQPWGYAESDNETRNALISSGDRRSASEGIELEERQVKPYTFQLYPVKASVPVPYTLLREYAEMVTNEHYSLDEFLCVLKNRRVNTTLLQKIWVRGKSENLQAAFFSLCKKILKVSNSYLVFLLDAGNVAEKDIALYFSRIGKGGVVPSDEELAYSVLKSKLDDRFRSQIEKLHEEFGIANQSRIAHLAIRLFKSLEDENEIKFYNGSVFSAAVEMCKDADSDERKAFNQFVEKVYEVVKRLYDKNVLTQWHLTRYASERNGDIFLFLLIAQSRNLFDGYNIFGVAELLFSYSSHTDYAIRKIFDEGLQVGLARLLKETHYNSHRLLCPIDPDKSFSALRKEEGKLTIQDLMSWQSTNPDVVEFVAQGYGNSPHSRALNILLYACRGSKVNDCFAYNKELGVWSEESCPWDYDHIMPHSVIEKMPDSNEKVVCEWLKNSIGNLAPIPFSLNRSLSDSVRDRNYPFCDGRGRKMDKVGETQKELHLKGDVIANMWQDEKNGQISPSRFCIAVFNRFLELYQVWYKELGIKTILNFETALDDVRYSSALQKTICRRWLVMREVKNKLQGKCEMSYKRIVADSKEEDIPEAELHRSFCAEDYITLSNEIQGVSVAITKYRTGGSWEIGFRKSCSESSASRETLTRVEKLLKEDICCDVSKELICKDVQWWYLYEECADSEEVGAIVDALSDRIKKLVELAGKLN